MGTWIRRNGKNFCNISVEGPTLSRGRTYVPRSMTWNFVHPREQETDPEVLRPTCRLPPWGGLPLIYRHTLALISTLFTTVPCIPPGTLCSTFSFYFTAVNSPLRTSFHHYRNIYQYFYILYSPTRRTACPFHFAPPPPHPLYSNWHRRHSSPDKEILKFYQASSKQISPEVPFKRGSFIPSKIKNTFCANLPSAL